MERQGEVDVQHVPLETRTLEMRRPTPASASQPGLTVFTCEPPGAADIDERRGTDAEQVPQEDVV